MKRIKLLFVALCLLSFAASAQQVRETVRCIAHRGGRFEYDENTVFAFQQSYNLGFRGFETDVRLTSDGVPVIMHDVAISRTMDGKGIVEEHEYSYFKNIPTKGGHNMPTLAELLEFFNSKENLYVEFELKSDSPTYPEDKMMELADKVYDMVYKDKPESSEYVISSFDHRAIKYLKAKHPEGIYMPIFESSLFDSTIAKAKEMGVTRIACRLHGTSYFKVQEARKAGMELVSLWPEKNITDCMLALSVGSDILCLDAPRETKEWFSANAPWANLKYE